MDEFDCWLDTAVEAFAPPPGLEQAMLCRVTGGPPPTPKEIRRRTAAIFTACFGGLSQCLEQTGNASSLQWMSI